MESLRGMNGVVASSSTGWGVARFMLVVAAQNDLWLLVWSWQKTRQWLLCLPHQPESFWWQRVLFYGTAGELFA